MVSKASSGAAEALPVHSVERPEELANVLRQRGWSVVEATQQRFGNHASLPLDDFTPEGNTMIVLG